jgi:hypothetical protein
MNKNSTFMNGGFPPIYYCKTNDKITEVKKERFFSNSTKQNINIRQILSENVKKPIIITEDNNDELEVVETL